MKVTENRQNLILERLNRNGVVLVEALSEELGVSAITIRRDLKQMHGKALLERIHGGALPLKNQQKELLFEDRSHMQVKEKTAIAQEIASKIKDHSIIFVNSGSTTLEVIRALACREVQVITNNIDALKIFTEANKPLPLELILIGGQYRKQSHSIIGDMTLSFISDIYSSYTVLGVNGIHPDYGVTSSFLPHVSLNRLMIKNCKGNVIIAADSSKINAISDFVTAPLAEIDELVTDAAADPGKVALLRQDGLHVTLI